MIKISQAKAIKTKTEPCKNERTQSMIKSRDSEPREEQKRPENKEPCQEPKNLNLAFLVKAEVWGFE